MYMPHITTLHLTADMIDKTENVQPYQIIIDVPLKYDSLPDEVQQIILQALAADVDADEKDIQQGAITVYAAISCYIRRHARRSPDSPVTCALTYECDDICITAYGITTHETGEQPANAILGNIAAYITKNSTGADSQEAQAYISHIIDDMRLLILVNGSTTSALLKNIP